MIFDTSAETADLHHAVALPSALRMALRQVFLSAMALLQALCQTLRQVRRPEVPRAEPRDSQGRQRSTGSILLLS